MMGFFWQCASLLGMAVAIAVSAADVKVDCGHDSVSVTWKEARSQIDPSLLRLGDCPPMTVSDGQAEFHAEFSDCGFWRMVTGDQLTYISVLNYKAAPMKARKAFSHPVVCAYERPLDWLPPMFNPVLFHTYGQGHLVFHMGLMNEDFSGPARSSAFLLGSLIPIWAAVEQKDHQPLLLLLEECVAASTPELHPESHVYPIITDNGCLMDSKTTNSKFQPRQETSEIHLSLQAFKFPQGEEIYIYCKLVAWDPTDLDSSKKACHYVKDHGWELLDDSSHSSLCKCCDSSCKPRRRRRVASGMRGLTQKAVLGPLTIIG